MNENSKKLFKICKSSIEMLKTLVDDFIDFTRFENESTVPINKKNVNLKDLITNVKYMFEIQTEEKLIDLTTNIDTNVPDFFRTDPLRLRQILMNLLSNSLKFTSRGSIEVNVSYKKSVEVDSEYDLKCSEESKISFPNLSGKKTFPSIRMIGNDSDSVSPKRMSKNLLFH
jgi:signal transduction histidine kinase